MRIEEQTRTNNDSDSDPNFESGSLHRVRAQYESMSRPVSGAIVESRPRGDFEEVPCRLAPAIRRRRLVS